MSLRAVFKLLKIKLVFIIIVVWQHNLCTFRLSQRPTFEQKHLQNIMHRSDTPMTPVLIVCMMEMHEMGKYHLFPFALEPLRLQGWEVGGQHPPDQFSQLLLSLSYTGKYHLLQSARVSESYKGRGARVDLGSCVFGSLSVALTKYRSCPLLC